MSEQFKYSGFRVTRRCNADSESSNVHGAVAADITAAIKSGNTGECPALKQSVVVMSADHSPSRAVRSALDNQQRWTNPCDRCGTLPEITQNLDVIGVSRTTVREAEFNGKPLLDASQDPNKARKMLGVKRLIEQRYDLD